MGQPRYSYVPGRFAARVKLIPTIVLTSMIWLSDLPAGLDRGSPGLVRMWTFSATLSSLFVGHPD